MLRTVLHNPYLRCSFTEVKFGSDLPDTQLHTCHTPLCFSQPCDMTQLNPQHYHLCFRQLSCTVAGFQFSKNQRARGLHRQTLTECRQVQCVPEQLLYVIWVTLQRLQPAANWHMKFTLCVFSVHEGKVEKLRLWIPTVNETLFLSPDGFTCLKHGWTMKQRGLH